MLYNEKNMKPEVKAMRRYRCIVCKHEFETKDNEVAYKCPECYERFVELTEGPAIKGKAWGSKSFSMRGGSSK